MRTLIASGIFCAALFAVSCKERSYNPGEVKTFTESEPGICDNFVKEAQGKKGKEIFECKSEDNNVKICLQLDKGLLGTGYKVSYSTFRKTTSGSSSSGDTFTVPNLVPLDNLTTSSEVPDPESLILISRRINGNGSGGFGYLAETRLEFKNSFESVRIVRSDIKEKNPTANTPRDTLFDLQADACKKLLPANQAASEPTEEKVKTDSP